MNLSKENIKYKGREYPVVYVDFSNKERHRHDISYEYLRFASYAMISSFPKDEGRWTDEEYSADSQVDFYSNGKWVEKYCKGKISEGAMKMFLGRIIIETFIN